MRHAPHATWTAAWRRVASLGTAFVIFWSLYPYVAPWGFDFTVPVSKALRYGMVSGLIMTITDLWGWWLFGVWTDVERRAARAAFLALAFEVNGLFIIDMTASNGAVSESFALLHSTPGIVISLLFYVALYLPAYGLLPACDRLAWTPQGQAATDRPEAPRNR